MSHASKHRGPSIHRYLDPGDALAEAMFGLIMTLTFTVGARFFLVAEEFDRNELIIGAVGCNIAWGVIDAVLYVVSLLFFRSQRARFYKQLRGIEDAALARAAAVDHFGLADEPLAIAPEDRSKFYDAILTLGRHATPLPVRIRRDDLIAASIIFVLVTFAAVPSVVPLLLIEDPSFALGVSNAIQVVLLFWGGYRWGTYTDVASWKVGLSIAVLGIGMCILAVFLGG